MIGQTVGELLEEKVTLDVEGIDRLYLNLYQPRLQTGAGVAAFFKQHRGANPSLSFSLASRLKNSKSVPNMGLQFLEYQRGA